MPQYFSDLASVKKLAEQMSDKQEEGKKYTGVIPENEADLPQARIELGGYMREVWQDEVFALEIEEAVSEDNYKERIGNAAMRNLFELKK